MKKFFRKFRREIRAAIHHVLAVFARPGTKSWLIEKERKFGGLVVGAPRNKVSELDPRSSAEILEGGMTGGDRMLHHGYARYYSQYLSRFLERPRVVLVEVGILKGSGLAIWCDLFPSGRVIGMDIDLEHTLSNMENLESLGAFRSNRPELYEFDQLGDKARNIELMDGILAGEKVDIFIDDGLHTDDAIINTLEVLMEFLSDGFVYIIEDNSGVHKKVYDMYKDIRVTNFGKLTILER